MLISVFEGQFKFTPDEKHETGYLYAEEIAFMADFEYFRLCFSGRGKVRREGSIGSIWSFNSIGVWSVIGGL